jgi:hypothetical protein
MVTPRHGGGNNRLYRVETVDGRCYALKWYPQSVGDSRDRLGAEWSALEFLARQKVSDVPRGIAFDAVAGFALYEWIEGGPVDHPDDRAIAAAIAFVTKLHELRQAAGAEVLAPASEACRSAAEVLDQVDRRLARLRDVAEGEPSLAEFLHQEFLPQRSRVEHWVRAGFALRGWDFDRPLDADRMTLSPSDFGFHNALRRVDGTIAFIDFEYFGWDDPVKLMADFLQHPGMSLSPQLAETFRLAMLSLFGGDDEAVADRLRLMEPLYTLRWCMILLNEFLPERWQTRAFAGRYDDRQRATQVQLSKARRQLARLLSQVTESNS